MINEIFKNKKLKLKLKLYLRKRQNIFGLFEVFEARYQNKKEIYVNEKQWDYAIEHGFSQAFYVRDDNKIKLFGLTIIKK